MGLQYKKSKLDVFVEFLFYFIVIVTGIVIVYWGLKLFIVEADAAELKPDYVEKRISYRAVWTDVDSHYFESSPMHVYEASIDAEPFGHEVEAEARFRWNRPFTLQLEPCVRARWSNGHVKVKGSGARRESPSGEWLLFGKEADTEFTSVHVIAGLTLLRPFQVKSFEISPLIGVSYWYQKLAFDTRFTETTPRRIASPGLFYSYEAWSVAYGLRVKWNRLELELRRSDSFNEDLEKEATGYRSDFDLDTTELRGLFKLSRKLGLDVRGSWSDFDIDAHLGSTHAKKDRDVKSFLIGLTYSF